MNETLTKDRIETATVQEAPAPQLPAIRQERKPRAQKSDGALSSPLALHFPAAIAVSILAVSRDIGAIAKEGKNDFQHYRYVKWEDINDKLSPLLAQHNLIIVQSEISRSLLEENEKGSVLAIVYHFTIINEKGEQWPAVEWTGIARLRDSKGVTDDKAATKCHTQAEKYFCIKQFKIRVEDSDPSDRTHTLPKKEAREVYSRLQAEIDETQTALELISWGKEAGNVKRKKTLPPDWQDIITTRYNEKLAELQGGPKVIWDDETGEIIEEGEHTPSATSNAVQQPAPATQPSEAAAGAGTSLSPEILAMAREAAQRGPEVLKVFFNGRTPAEKKELRKIEGDLVMLYPAETMAVPQQRNASHVR